MHKANKPNAPVASLSSKLQGLKFMQRGAAPAPAAATPAATATATAQPSTSAQATPQTGSTSQLQVYVPTVPARPDGTEDGNVEHWVLPFLSSSATTQHPSSVPQHDGGASSRETAAFAQLGWNDWLVTHQQERTGTKRKRGLDDDDEEVVKVEDDDEEVKDTAEEAEGAEIAVVGRRKFGSWVVTATKKRRKSENGEEQGGQQDEEEEDDEGKVVPIETPSKHNRFAAVRESNSSSGLRKSTGQGRKGISQSSSGRGSGGSSSGGGGHIERKNSRNR
ncbi:unnamed protein product [Tilletia controversa]|uniref:Uncharacterized protein n=3 Tax=Tilletia TaxID=13289 RepID=A0A8X7MXD6_9BASI|nr:hypothetical protein CF336_g4627 [Tilletia laevis]KAE8199766.1 hypothetical protein CF328_g3152 [Tilletia controversa]KAE8256301.1 hypothetical protein A4X03_0g5431 [Tilletia caries]KAE8200388.1 hypothetical protein CF335_g3972 [Tilletia laevis]KAE8253314.1 hypothetical protein A4X06_0g1547 [Tilletia controversa]